MPYEGEFAEYRSIRRLTENERVKALLQRAKEREVGADNHLPVLQRSDIQPSRWQPEMVLSVDGSYQAVLVEKGYPGSEVGYVTVASVLMDVAKIRELDKKRPADPKIFRSTENATSIDRAFPGCNIVIDDESSPAASLRKSIFEALADTQVFSDGESLLDTYEFLFSHRDLAEPSCPYKDGCLSPNGKCTLSKGQFRCTCLQQNVLYSTDGLRIHEGMVGDSSNGAMFAEIMQTLERLLVIHILRWLEQKELLWLLRDMAIVIDGPLAIFGHPAGLLQPFSKEIKRLNERAKGYTDGAGILLIGVEKTGLFVSHFERLDQRTDGSGDAFPPQAVALLTDAYIKRNIIFSDSKKPYGKETYFGRKFFYKTLSGACIVASLPFLDEKHEDVSRAVPAQFPRLADALALFDQLASSRYPNALSPLISANAEAAIPMNLGSRVLEEMAKKLIKQRRS